jgi:hypothetical protein
LRAVRGSYAAGNSAVTSAWFGSPDTNENQVHRYSHPVNVLLAGAPADKRRTVLSQRPRDARCLNGDLPTDCRHADRHKGKPARAVSSGHAPSSNHGTATVTRDRSRTAPGQRQASERSLQSDCSHGGCLVAASALTTTVTCVSECPGLSIGAIGVAIVLQRFFKRPLSGFTAFAAGPAEDSYRLPDIYHHRHGIWKRTESLNRPRGCFVKHVVDLLTVRKGQWFEPMRLPATWQRSVTRIALKGSTRA